MSDEPAASGSPVGSLAGGSGSPIGSRQDVDSPERIGALQANWAVTNTHAAARVLVKERSEIERLGKGMIHPTAGRMPRSSPVRRLTSDLDLRLLPIAPQPTRRMLGREWTGTESPPGLLRLQGPPAGHFAGT